MRRARLLVPLALVALLGAACGGGGNGGDGGNGGNGGGPVTDSVTMVDNAFEPQSFTVASGDSITITNEGQALHSFTVADADIDVDIVAGQGGDQPISADPGTYDVTCKYHPEMTATMTVE